MDLSPCEDEAVVKEGRKRRAEVEEDVDGNCSRAKNVFATLGVLLVHILYIHLFHYESFEIAY